MNVPSQTIAQKLKTRFDGQVFNITGSKAKKRQWKRGLGLSDKDSHTPFDCTNNSSIGMNSVNVPSRKPKASFSNQVSNRVVANACTCSEDINITVEKRKIILLDNVELERSDPSNGFRNKRLILPDRNELEEAVSTSLGRGRILYNSNTAVPPSDRTQGFSTYSVMNGITLNGDTIRQKPSSDDVAEFQEANQTESLKLKPSLSYEPMEQFCMPAQPVWSGCFDVCNLKHGRFTAHKSSGAHFKVDDAVKKFVPVLHMAKLSRLNAWPDRFIASPPTDVDIALFFFPSDERSGPVIDQLLEDIICGDFMLKYTLDDAELLVFASIHLPEQFHRIGSKLYFWGAFRNKGVSIVVDSCGPDQPSEGPCSCLRQEAGRSFGEGERVFDKHVIVEPAQQKVIEKQTIDESTHPPKVELNNAESIESLQRLVSFATTAAKYYFQLKDLVKRKKNMRKPLILEERLQKGS